MTDAFISLSVIGACFIAVCLVLEMGVRVQKWWMWQRTRRQQERDYIAWAKRQAKREQ